MSRPVVDRFGMVKIQDQEDHAPTATDCQGNCMFEAIEHQQAIWQTSQRIVVCLMTDDLFIVFLVCDVMQAEDVPNDHPIGQLRN